MEQELSLDTLSELFISATQRQVKQDVIFYADTISDLFKRLTEAKLPEETISELIYGYAEWYLAKNFGNDND